MTTPTARHTEIRARKWSKAPTFGDPTVPRRCGRPPQRDRERYLTSGLVSVDCRFCHVAVDVKKLGPGAHIGAMEHRGVAALRLLRRDPAVRRRPRPRAVLPEARRQHQTRCRRRLSGRESSAPSARRRLSFTLTAMVTRWSGLLLGIALTGCTQVVDTPTERPAPPVAPITAGQVGDLLSPSVKKRTATCSSPSNPRTAAASPRRWIRPSSSTSTRRQPTVGIGWSTTRPRGVHRGDGRRLSRRLRPEARTGAGKAHHRVLPGRSVHGHRHARAASMTSRFCPR